MKNVLIINGHQRYEQIAEGKLTRITSYNVCYTKLLRVQHSVLLRWVRNILKNLIHFYNNTSAS